MKNILKPLYHFTKTDIAYKILESRQFLASKVLICNDPFEMDNSPVSISFNNENQFSWYCKALLNLCKNKNPVLSSLTSKIAEKSDSEALAIIERVQREKLSENGSLLVLGDILELEDFRKLANIYCFSEANVQSSVLLWSHYANRHNGVALEFSFPPSEFGNHLHKVNYDSKNIRGGIFTPKQLITLFEGFENNTEVQQNFFKKTTLNKHYDWKYEQEWRFISIENSHDDTQKPYFSINHNLITAVYFGLQATLEEKEKLIALIKNQYPETKIFIPKKDNKFIKMNFHPWDG